MGAFWIAIVIAKLRDRVVLHYDARRGCSLTVVRVHDLSSAVVNANANATWMAIRSETATATANRTDRGSSSYEPDPYRVISTVISIVTSSSNSSSSLTDLKSAN